VAKVRHVTVDLGAIVAVKKSVVSTDECAKEIMAA
jgi:hypothetical protein